MDTPSGKSADAQKFEDQTFEDQAFESFEPPPLGAVASKTTALGDHPVPARHVTQIARLLRTASASCVCEIPDGLASRTIARCFDLPHPAETDDSGNI